MTIPSLPQSVEAYRRFNRFYTKQIGLLGKGLLKTRFPLTQARVLYELAQHKKTTAKELLQELNLDPGYLSRVLTAFEKDGLLTKTRAENDSRKRELSLTDEGRKAFAELNARSKKEAESILHRLSAENRKRLLHAMQTIEDVLAESSRSKRPFLLRQHETGDIGWLIYRHGVLYAEEQGYDESFEALVAKIAAAFANDHNPKRERFWVAELDGERIGSVMIVDAGENVAQLRLMLVEPKARGLGVGKRLVEQCVTFSRRAGYKKIRLWTQSNLLPARRLYANAGFVLVEENSESRIGEAEFGEIWELDFSAQKPEF